MMSSRLSRSGPAILVAVLHVAVIYVFSVSIGIVKAPSIIQPAEVVFVPSPQEEQKSEPVKVTQPDIAQPNVTVLTPEVVPEVPMDIAPIEAAPATAPIGSLQELRATHRVEPTYPATSRRLGEEGSVLLRVFVDATGRPQQVMVDRSSGHARLDQAALNAVKRWRFLPATSGSGPVGAWSRVTITFRLQ